MSKEKGLILIPAFNEEKNIQRVYFDLKENKVPYDIIVIDDGSQDKTTDALKKHAVRYLSHPINLGYGASLQTGYLFALKNNYDFIIQFDADFQHRADEIQKLVQEHKKSKTDIVIGSRFSRKEGQKISLLKLFAIKLFSILIKTKKGPNIKDLTSGFQLINKKAFSYFATSEEFPIDYPDANIILLSKKKKFVLKEVSVKMRDRKLGRGMFTLSNSMIYFFQMLINILIIRIRR